VLYNFYSPSMTLLLNKLEVLVTGKPFGACIIKRITAVIYGFRNKLECLSLNTKLGWKVFQGTNTLA
jgi:hypothetical protein